MLNGTLYIPFHTHIEENNKDPRIMIIVLLQFYNSIVIVQFHCDKTKTFTGQTVLAFCTFLAGGHHRTDGKYPTSAEL